MTYMFHVSRFDLGERVILTPKIPKAATSDECRITPRVCFSPTVDQCVIGLVGYALSSDITFLGAFHELANASWCPTVYWTTDYLYKPDMVSDFHITEEHWALDPIEVDRFGYIDCLAMVREKRIVIVDEPRYVEYPDLELVTNLKAEDKEALLYALSLNEWSD